MDISTWINYTWTTLSKWIRGLSFTTTSVLQLYCAYTYHMTSVRSCVKWISASVSLGLSVYVTQLMFRIQSYWVHIHVFSGTVISGS